MKKGTHPKRISSSNDSLHSYAGIIRIRFNRSESFLHSLSACRGKLPLFPYSVHRAQVQKSSRKQACVRFIYL